MTAIRQLTRVAVTAAATLSGAYVIYNNAAKKPALASGNDDNLAGRLFFQPCGQKWDSNWDLQQDNDKKRRKSKDENVGPDSTNNYEGKDIKPTGTRHLIFIRHGQYNDQADKDEQRSLTELGRTQAEMTGQRLKDLNFKYTILMNSTMKRAVETADIISKYLPDVPREECCMLREGAPIVPEPRSSNWRPEKAFFQDNARIEAAFRKHVHRADVEQVGDSVEVYVCHANVIRYFVCRALQFPPEGWLRMSINHCGITWLTVRPNGRVSLRSLGDTGHLTPGSIS